MRHTGGLLRSGFFVFCLGLFLVSVLPASAAKLIPAGKGYWIDYSDKARYALNVAYQVDLQNSDQLADYLVNNLGCQWVACKCAGGTEPVSDFTTLVGAFRKASSTVRVYGWDMVTGVTNPHAEGVLARQQIDNSKADGLIIVPYVSSWTKNNIFYANGLNKGNSYWGGLNAGGSGAIQFAVGYCADSNFNNQYYGNYYPTAHDPVNPKPLHNLMMSKADFWMPRVFWRKETPTMTRLAEEQAAVTTFWLNQANQKPVVVLGQCQGLYPGADSIIPAFKNMVSQWTNAGYPVYGSNLFRMDSFKNDDFANW